MGKSFTSKKVSLTTKVNKAVSKTNAKHGTAPAKTSGEVKISLKPKEKEIVMAVGMFHAANIHNPKRDWVQALANQTKTPEGFKKSLGNIKKKGVLTYSGSETVALTKDIGVPYVVANGGGVGGIATNKMFHDLVLSKLVSKKALSIIKKIDDGCQHDKLQVAKDLGYDMDKLSGYEKDLSKMKTMKFLEKTKTTIQLTGNCFPCGRPN